jgi:hypothetical protein
MKAKTTETSCFHKKYTSIIYDNGGGRLVYINPTNTTKRMANVNTRQFNSALSDHVAKETEKLQAEIDRLKKEVERLESSDAWINLSDEKPIEEKMCQCYCPDEPIDIVQIGFWDNNYGFIDNNDHPVNAEKWKYVKLPLATPPTTKVKSK